MSRGNVADGDIQIYCIRKKNFITRMFFVVVLAVLGIGLIVETVVIARLVNVRR